MFEISLILYTFELQISIFTETPTYQYRLYRSRLYQPSLYVKLLNISSIYGRMYKRASATTTRLFLKKIDALAFLPPSLVVEGWNILMNENPCPNDRKLKDFIKYKETYYIGTSQWRRPQALGYRRVLLNTRNEARLLCNTIHILSQ